MDTQPRPGMPHVGLKSRADEVNIAQGSMDVVDCKDGWGFLRKAGPTSSGVMAEDDITPDQSRVILHFDVDAFYAQVEEMRDPSLRDKPLGITQKFLVVTCNYPARAAGVGKLTSIQEALKICPELVLVNGEDLTPYREASRRIYNVLSRFGPAERLGMDEVFVDISDPCRRARDARATDAPDWCGFVHTSGESVEPETRYRVMDIRVPAGQAAGCYVESSNVSPGDALLRAGAVIAKEARDAVKQETGFRCCAGIAHNKMLSKLCGGLHKPDQQTSLPSVIKGVGWKTAKELGEMGVSTVLQLRAIPRRELARVFGDKVAVFMYEAARARDSSEVVSNSAPKSITVEDSFRACTSFRAIEGVFTVLAPDLVHRVWQDASEHGRVPETLTVKWRHSRIGTDPHRHSRVSASTKIPQKMLSENRSASSGQSRAISPQAAACIDAAMEVIKKNLKEPFHLTQLSITVSRFGSSAAHRQQIHQPTSAMMSAEAMSEPAACGDKASSSRRNYDERIAKNGAAGASGWLSKREERMLREAHKGPRDTMHFAIDEHYDVGEWRRSDGESEEDDEGGGSPLGHMPRGQNTMSTQKRQTSTLPGSESPFSPAQKSDSCVRGAAAEGGVMGWIRSGSSQARTTSQLSSTQVSLVSGQGQERECDSSHAKRGIEQDCQADASWSSARKVARFSDVEKVNHTSPPALEKKGIHKFFASKSDQGQRNAGALETGKVPAEDAGVGVTEAERIAGAAASASQKPGELDGVRVLMSMGFTDRQAIDKALSLAAGNIQNAVESLLCPAKGSGSNSASGIAGRGPKGGGKTSSSGKGGSGKEASSLGQGGRAKHVAGGAGQNRMDSYVKRGGV